MIAGGKMEATDKSIIIALIGIGLYAFFVLVDWIKQKNG